jgi:Putative prokaryotic signal transducing protein
VDEGVRLTVVGDEMEAEALCGLLRSAGIRCGHRPTTETDSLVDNFGSGGPHEVLVLESDLETARELLDATPEESS